MTQIVKQTAEGILDASASHIGKTDWYFNLHFYRFIHIINIIIERTSGVKKETILELGVWPGYLALSLHEAGFDFWGIDIDSSRIKQTGIQLNIADYDLNSPSLKIPYPENHFDYIVASEIIEHLNPKNIPGLFIEIGRLLNKNGLAIITTPNKKSLHNFLFGKKISSSVKNGHGHICEYTIPELQKFINESPLLQMELKAVNFYSNIGSLPEGKYFYPLKKFWKYPNKLFNLLKFCSIPLKHFPILKDSIILLIQKNG